VQKRSNPETSNGFRNNFTEMIRDSVMRQLSITDPKKVPVFCGICGDLDNLKRCGGMILCDYCREYQCS
jgi:hypothetical protein